MGEFRLRVAGKVYTIESTIDDCQRIGGDLMAIDYHMVCTLLLLHSYSLLLQDADRNVSINLDLVS